jgi:transcriptional regulator with XRE-family HTH domain
MAISELRLARVSRGLTMDQLFLQSRGALLQPRLSRIERGLAKPSEREVEWLVKILEVDERSYRLQSENLFGIVSLSKKTACVKRSSDEDYTATTR